MNRVLIVEDDTLLNTTLAYHLQGRGMGTESAFCCREAREKLGALRYDLVMATGLPFVNRFSRNGKRQ